jgi:hypothetical protein
MARRVTPFYKARLLPLTGVENKGHNPFAESQVLRIGEFGDSFIAHLLPKPGFF